jgi:plastocyanin
LLLLATTAYAAPGKVTGKVVVNEKDGKPAKNAIAVVYIVGFTEPPATPADQTAAVIEQKGRKFVPDLVTITAGETVSFPNGDPLLHNVFSQSAARKFDLGSFKKGESKSKMFPNTGVVDVFCNIHVEMAATILVLPNRHHVRVDANGAYTLEGIPPGKYTVFAFARRLTKPVSQEVTIVDGQATTADFTLVRGPEPEHPNKFGEPYEGGYD